MWDKLILYGLATWRVSYMLITERGPADMFVYLRSLIGIGHNDDMLPISFPDTFFGNLFSCMYCLSVWVGFFWYCCATLLPERWTLWVSIPLAVSAIAIIIDTAIEKY